MRIGGDGELESDGLPPRVDLQLQALSEVQRGERWIHCHSYRQDEIVATLDVLEEFGIRIGTLQHILEGYKVADRIRQHGAMASAFPIGGRISSRSLMRFPITATSCTTRESSFPSIAMIGN